MPTIPLHNQPSNPDSWHEVTAPGGYEYWYFDAEDTAGQLRMVAIFFQGFVFHPGYLKAYRRFIKRPTRTTPPLPSQYPCVYFALYRGSEIVTQFISQFPSEKFAASTDRAEVSIGSNRLTTHADGSLEISVAGVPWASSTHPHTASADFRFRPVFRHEPMQRRFISRDWSNADHHWVIANPLCEMTGEVRIADQAISLSGPGYHDHNYGTGPIGPGLRRWMWGRVLMPGHAVTFHFAQPEDGAFADDVHLLEADELELREVPINRFNADWSRKAWAFLKYPAWVEAGPLQLSNPQMIDASPFYLRLSYDASVRGVTGVAFCEVAYPSRLRWPIIGRMIEKAIRISVHH